MNVKTMKKAKKHLIEHVLNTVVESVPTYVHN